MKHTPILAMAASALVLAACSAPEPETDAEAITVARDCNTPDGAAILQVERPGSAGDAAANAEASEAYLAAVREERCVYELDSGLMFRIRDAVNNEDAISPQSGDRVTVHYRGLFPYGDEFDSSYARGEPMTFRSDRLIAGWVEALPMMRTGERWELYIPADLAYGARGTPGGPIGPDQALVFELELLDVPDRSAAAEAADSTH